VSFQSCRLALTVCPASSQSSSTVWGSPCLNRNWSSSRICSTPSTASPPHHPRLKIEKAPSKVFASIGWGLPASKEWLQDILWESRWRSLPSPSTSLFQRASSSSLWWFTPASPDLGCGTSKDPSEGCLHGSKFHR
jgi:hypothetical protein